MRRSGDLRRSIKNNAPVYCSAECFGLNRRRAGIAQKECTVCGTIKPASEFRERTQYDRKYRVAMCRPCERERSISQADPEKKSAYSKRRYESRSDDERIKAYAYAQSWRERNREYAKEKNAEWHKTHSVHASDKYVKRSFRGAIKENDAHYDEKIHTKRTQILTKRLKKLINKQKDGKK